MRTAARIIGALWIFQGLALATEEVMRVVRAEAGVSLGIALALYAIVALVGLCIITRATGWTIVAVLAAAYQGASHFIFLSNMWPHVDYAVSFALFVVCLSVGTVILAIGQWTTKIKNSGTAPNAH